MTFAADFLRLPDLFPGRRSGEVWGRERVDLGIAGGAYAVSGLSEEQAAAVRRRFGSAAPPPPDPAAVAVEVRVFAAPAADFLPVETAGREVLLDFDFQPRAVRLAGIGLMARIDWQPALAAGLWTAAAGEAFLGAFENLLRALVAYRLTAAGGALLHSAGIVDDGAACLFFGPSGAGKTTVSRLSRAAGRQVLSDDLNALERRGGATAVLPVPFAGDFPAAGGGPGSYPLRRLLRLEQGEDHRLRPLGRSAGLAALAACAPFVNADRHRQDRLLANLESLTRDVAVESLTFRRDGGFWELLSA